jgi:hypothetical protein
MFIPSKSINSPPRHNTLALPLLVYAYASIASCSSSPPVQLTVDTGIVDFQMADATNQLDGPDIGESGFVLLDVSNIHWAYHRSRHLLYPHFRLAACDAHFPTGTISRTQIETSAAYYNAVDDLDLSIEVTGTPHLEVDGLYATDRKCDDAVAHMDYTYEGFPCHARNENGWTNSFAMNACSYSRSAAAWGKSGAACFFNVAVDPYSRNYDEDLNATDYPKAANIAHELGHGFGMIHTPSWPEADRGLISTMQGNLNTLSSYDIAYLRYFYGKEGSEPRVDLVPSPIYRGEGNQKKIFFGKEHVPTGKSKAVLNPSLFYIDGDFLKDCATQSFPIFSISIFNRGALGTAELSDKTPFEGELRLKRSDNEAYVSLHPFSFPEMPRESQLQWQGSVNSSPASFFKDGDGDVAYEIVLQLNTKARGDMDQPQISAAVKIVADAASCE